MNLTEVVMDPGSDMGGDGEYCTVNIVKKAQGVTEKKQRPLQFKQDQGSGNDKR